MKIAIRYFLPVCLFLLFLNIVPGFARPGNNHRQYREYYTGCWRVDSLADDYLITYADQRFQWRRPATTGARADTLEGTWLIRARYSIPFKMTVIVLRYKNGQRKKYEVNPLSVPAAIYLPEGRRFYKIPCDQ